MSPERRYNEEEIAAIFKQAAEHQESAAQQQQAHNDGLTLAELKQIGEEAGITPEFIARAAAAVDQTAKAGPPMTYFGLPISVARTVDLPGPLSDDAWDRLVVDLRQTFHASGEVQRSGTVREWRNGNLKAMIEPTESGHRLRLWTFKGNAKGTLQGGLAYFAMMMAFLLMVALSGTVGLNPQTLFVALLGLAGLGATGFMALRLPRWADERARQMEAIAARAVELAEPAPAAPLPEPAPTHRLDLDAAAPEDAVQARTRGRTRL